MQPPSSSLKSGGSPGFSFGWQRRGARNARCEASSRWENWPSKATIEKAAAEAGATVKRVLVQAGDAAAPATSTVLNNSRGLWDSLPGGVRASGLLLHPRPADPLEVALSPRRKVDSVPYLQKELLSALSRAREMEKRALDAELSLATAEAEVAKLSKASKQKR